MAWHEEAASSKLHKSASCGKRTSLRMTSCRSDMQRNERLRSRLLHVWCLRVSWLFSQPSRTDVFLSNPRHPRFRSLLYVLLFLVLLWWQWQSWWKTDNRAAVVWCQDRFNKTNERNHDTRWWKDFSARVCDKDDSSFDVRDGKERVDGAFCPRQLLKGVEEARENENHQRWGKLR